MKLLFHRTSIVTALLLTLSSLPVVGVQGGNPEPNTGAEIKAGGGGYTTTTSRESKGELSQADFRQVSLLASRILVHLDEASKQLIDGRGDAAKPELEQTQTLVGIIRDILPVTTVETVVKDQSGKEVYRDVDTVQNDRIPIFRHMIEVDVIEPVVELKNLDAEGLTPVELKGMRLADAEVINTSVLLDLSYVERKINRALEQLEQADVALASVVLAQTDGVQFITNKVESPLVAAQSALRLAELQIEDQRYEAAEENLSLARLNLDAYRQALGEQAGGKVDELRNQIEALSGKLRQEGARKKVRGFWDRITSWFRIEPGQTEPTGRPSQTES